MTSIPLSPYHIGFDETTKHDPYFLQLVEKWHLVEQQDAILVLTLEDNKLKIKKSDEPKVGPVYVDFVEGTLNHRRQFGGGRGEAIAKACGIKGDYLPSVIDATAGLGRDAFVLASIGCHVTLLERHPVVGALLEDGLKRAYSDASIGDWMQIRMKQVIPTDLAIRDSQHILTALPQADVVYLDPMYPHPEQKKQRALIKKEMRIFQYLVGADMDADDLLTPALSTAKKRVVVKRPDYAPFLNNMPADGDIKTKNHRFDIYSSLIR